MGSDPARAATRAFARVCWFGSDAHTERRSRRTWLLAPRRRRGARANRWASPGADKADKGRRGSPDRGLERRFRTSGHPIGKNLSVRFVRDPEWVPVLTNRTCDPDVRADSSTRRPAGGPADTHVATLLRCPRGRRVPAAWRFRSNGGVSAEERDKLARDGLERRHPIGAQNSVGDRQGQSRTRIFLQSIAAIRYDAELGQRRPALGKILLAEVPPEQLGAYFRGRGDTARPARSRRHRARDRDRAADPARRESAARTARHR